MITKQKIVSNCGLHEADIALFPMVNSSINQKLPMSATRHKIAGIVQLPPIALNRIKLYSENGKTFTPKNVPLKFLVFDSDRNYSPLAIDKWYDELIFFIQENKFPAMWIIAPPDFCDYVLDTYLCTAVGSYYYHDPTLEEQQYYSITGTNPFEVCPVTVDELFSLS